MATKQSIQLLCTIATILLLMPCCKVPQICVSYNEIIAKREALNKRSILDSKKTTIYQGRYPICMMQNDNIIEKNIALQNQDCEGAYEFHCFSLIETDDQQVYFVSYSTDSTFNNISTDAPIIAKGGVIVYIGAFNKARNSVLFKERFLYSLTTRKYIAYNFGKKVSPKLRRKEKVKLEMKVNIKDNNLAISQIIDRDLNDITGDKPLIYDFQTILHTESINLSKGPNQ